MTILDSGPFRTLTVVLPESEWRALRAAEPDAIGWLQARIRERLSGRGVHHSEHRQESEDTDWAGE